MYKQITSGGICILVLLFCVQLSQQSTGGNEKPAVNFYGTVVNSDGKETKAENIVVAERYEKIPVYYFTQELIKDPSMHPISLNLAAITEIKIVKTTCASPESSTDKKEEPVLKRFKNKEYIAIEIIFHDKTSNCYLIEPTRIVSFDEDAKDIKHKPKISAINKIVIEGYKAREDEKKGKKMAWTKKREAAKNYP